MTTNQNQIPILQQKLRTANRSVMESIEGVHETEIRLIPAPDEWTVAQLLAHIAEIEYFWMEQAVLITNENNPNITRSDVGNDRRTSAVVDHAGDSLDDLIPVWQPPMDRPLPLLGRFPPVIWESWVTEARTIPSQWKA